MSFFDFYVARAQFCDDAAELSKDPNVISAMREEAAQNRLFAARVHVSDSMEVNDGR